MNNKNLTRFLVDARAKTYAGDSGKVDPILKGSVQLEFKKDNWLYRDIYNNGSGKFAGLETVYYLDKPVWSMSYFGNYQKLSEEEADSILRKALVAKKDQTRLWKDVKVSLDSYLYTCEGYGSIEEIGGTEKIIKKGIEVYYLYYAGGIVINEKS